jgi:hypothetical protein
MPGYKATVKNLEITIVPRITPQTQNVKIAYEGMGFGRMNGFPGGQGRWESVCFGAERGEAMCSFDFYATVAQAAAARGQPIVPPRQLSAGFIQNIISGDREAVYSRPSGAPIRPGSRTSGRTCLTAIRLTMRL